MVIVSKDSRRQRVEGQKRRRQKRKRKIIIAKSL